MPRVLFTGFKMRLPHNTAAGLFQDAVPISSAVRFISLIIAFGYSGPGALGHRLPVVSRRLLFRFGMVISRAEEAPRANNDDFDWPFLIILAAVSISRTAMWSMPRRLLLMQAMPFHQFRLICRLRLRRRDATPRDASRRKQAWLF